MPSQPDDFPGFFVDRSLGARIVPDAIRAEGFEVHTPSSLYGAFEDDYVNDEDWLRDVGQRGLIVLMKDKRIRYRPNEILAVSEANVRAFCLTSGNLRGHEQASRLVANLRKIQRIAASPGPYIYGVTSNSVERIWPPEARELDG